MGLADLLVVSVFVVAMGLLVWHAFFRPSPSQLRQRVDEARAEAAELEKQIDKLKKESTRATIDFEEAKRRYYARYGRRDPGKK